MKVAKKINIVRRIITQRLTKNIGKSILPKKGDPPAKKQINRILICRPNGRLGNLLLITPLIEDIIATFPNCKIDILVKGNLAPILFQNYENVDRLIQLPKKPFKSLFSYFKRWAAIRNNHYDLAINVIKHSSSGRLSTQISKATYKLFGNDELEAIAQTSAGYAHVAKYPVYDFRNFLLLLGVEENTGAIPNLDLKLNDSERIGGKNTLEDLVQNDKKTVSIFTYATCAKCYSTAWWEEFYGKLKSEIPGYNIIEILPIENISQINFQATTFYSKDVREIGAVIANTSLFIGADSGIMHLASAVSTPVLGLFSVTNPKTYEPYNPQSRAIDTNQFSVEDTIQAVKEILNSVGN